MSLFKFLPRPLRRKIVNGFTEAFLASKLKDDFVNRILEGIDKKYDVEEGKKFESTEEEVNKALKDVPALEPYRMYILNVCRNARRREGLSE